MEGKMDHVRAKECPDTIAIVGTGEFARALATRLLECNTRPVIGSRFPQNRQKNLPENDIFSRVKITSIQDCVSSSDVVVMAVHPEHHVTYRQLAPLLVGKVLVDVSNSLHASGHKSNAENLADLFPKSHVVKAFNTVAAFALLTMYENRSAYVCGDNGTAKRVVMQLASRLGFSVVDAGGLTASSKVEASNRRILPGWGWPTLVMFIVSVLWIVYTILRYYVLRDNPYDWHRIPTNVINKMCGVISATLLALVYIPGSIAACKQLANGTKHKRFHKSLDRWLKMRKQLGLYALFFGLMHTFMSMSLLKPAYFSSWFHSNSAVIPGNLTQDLEIDTSSRMTWYGETCTLLGFLAIATMSLLGITSVPSIANSLNWREWQCLQSYMGLVSLIFTVGHATTKGAASWVEETYKDILPSMAFTSMVLPWFALLLRFFFLLPCVYVRVRKIRRGWVSGEPQAVEIVIEGGMMKETGRWQQNGSPNPAFDDNTTF